MKKELYKFIQHLENSGLLVKSTDEIDYEKIIYKYMNYEVNLSGTVIMISKQKRKFKLV